MHWKVKAAIQNAVAVLPLAASYEIYYLLQRHFGGLRESAPTDTLRAGTAIWRHALRQGLDPIDRVFFEVGTGRAPIVPLAFWLMGARRTVTVDLNPYLKDEIVRESLEHIAKNPTEVALVFGDLLQTKRFELLIQMVDSALSVDAILNACGIEYVAPGDAARTGLEAKTIDVHTSYTVFEHIPPDVLADILAEGNRIIRDDGLFVHLVDYSDHFSHSDPTISAINFLQYSDSEWERYAGNRYMYMNRLRHDDMVNLFIAAGHRILTVEPRVDEQCREIVAKGRLKLNERFAAKSADIVGVRESWLVSEYNRGTAAP